jgi:hypothetical protein
MGKREAKRREMTKLMTWWQASGESAAAFAQEAGTPESQLWCWRRRIGAAEAPAFLAVPEFDGRTCGQGVPILRTKDLRAGNRQVADRRADAGRLGRNLRLHRGLSLAALAADMSRQTQPLDESVVKDGLRRTLTLRGRPGGDVSRGAEFRSARMPG